MTQIAVLCAGALGLSLVARAGALYRGSDRLAFSLVVLIGGLLIGGTIELLLRARANERMLGELDALPPTPSAEAIAATREPLRARLLARLSGSLAPAGPPLVSSYLLGLLVMVGLLGTFLGLFETLHGAREALTQSGDVVALRAGLAAPMQGLARAFGTSAAGVCASAMLGFAVLAVRRAEARVHQRIAAFGAGAGASLSVQGRMLAALEALVAQGASLPAAAASLGAVVASVESLTRDSAQRASEDRAHADRALASAMTTAMEKISIELREGAKLAASAVGEAVGPEVDRIVERTAQKNAEQIAALGAKLATEAKARSDRERESLAALDGVVRSLAERSESLATATGTRLEQAIDASATKLSAVVVALGETWNAQEKARAEAFSETANVALAKWSEQGDRLLVSNATAQAAALAESGAALGALRTDLVALVEGLTTRTESVVQALGAVQVAIGAVESATVSAERARAEVVSSSVDALRASLDSTVGAHAQHTAALLAKIDAIAARAHDELERSVAEAASALSELATRDEARRDEIAARDEARRSELAARDEARLLAALERDEARRVALGESLAALANKVADTAAAAPEAARALLDEARTRWSSEHEAQRAQADRLGALVGQLDALSKSLEQSQLAQAALIGDLGTSQAEAIAALSRDAAQSVRAVVEELPKVVERSGAQLEAFAASAEKRHEEALASLGGKLEAHAAGVVAALAENVALVREAGDLLRASTGEVATMAELFSASVDRYRAASDTWLEGLASLRSASDRAAAVEAQDLLGAYLDQTREVFDHSLQFQRQLFSELRALRAPGRAEDAS
jgi:hypothetical protein